MKTAQQFIVLGAVFALFAFSADAQTSRNTRRTPPKPKVVTSNTLPVAAAAEIQSGAQKVSIQIKNVTKFIYVLGGIARVIEDFDKEAKTKRPAQTAATQNETNKKEVIQAIRNLRAGLQALEVDFRTKTNLKKYLLQIQGITDMTAQSENLALAGRFGDSGKPLLLVVEKLSDTLAAMP